MEYGLIGEHLGHSYSCEIHAVIAPYKYELCELAPGELDSFMREKSFRAINVTIPYKQKVMQYLDVISETAQKIGAVNTVVNKNGRLYGYNTDFYGMKALAERLKLDFKGKKVLILGSGGTSKTAFAVAESMGAASILRVSRSGRDGALTYEQAAREHKDAQIIINATPCGMFPEVEAKPIELAPFNNLEGVLDVIYHPLRTDLVLDAREKRIAADGGLYMLAAQAVYACAFFMDVDADTALIDKAYGAVKSAKQNIALIGMPTSGKSSVGRLLSQRLAKGFADTDEDIAKSAGLTPAQLITASGEESFRRLEAQVLAKRAKESGTVIATGGGAVLRKENLRALKRNSVLVFLDRSPDKLLASADRPLSASRDELMRRYSERYEIYKAAADIRVDGDGTVEQTVKLIEEALLK